MHKVFGVKEKAEYLDREGTYLIPVHNNKIGVIKTATKQKISFIGFYHTNFIVMYRD